MYNKDHHHHHHHHQHHHHQTTSNSERKTANYQNYDYYHNYYSYYNNNNNNDNSNVNRQPQKQQYFQNKNNSNELQTQYHSKLQELESIQKSIIKAQQATKFKDPDTSSSNSKSKMFDWLLGKQLKLSKLKYPDIVVDQQRTVNTTPHSTSIKIKADDLLHRLSALKEKYVPKKKQNMQNFSFKQEYPAVDHQTKNMLNTQNQHDSRNYSSYFVKDFQFESPHQQNFHQNHQSNKNNLYHQHIPSQSIDSFQRRAGPNNTIKNTQQQQLISSNSLSPITYSSLDLNKKGNEQAYFSQQSSTEESPDTYHLSEERDKMFLREIQQAYSKNRKKLRKSSKVQKSKGSISEKYPAPQYFQQDNAIKRDEHMNSLLYSTSNSNSIKENSQFIQNFNSNIGGVGDSPPVLIIDSKKNNSTYPQQLVSQSARLKQSSRGRKNIQSTKYQPIQGQLVQNRHHQYQSARLPAAASAGNNLSATCTPAPHYQQLQSKYKKIQNKSHQMKQILRDYTIKIQSLQNQMQNQQNHVKNLEKQQQEQKQILANQFRKRLNEAQGSARYFQQGFNRLEQQNTKLNNYVEIMTHRQNSSLGVNNNNTCNSSTTGMNNSINTCNNNNNNNASLFTNNNNNKDIIITPSSFNSSISPSSFVDRKSISQTPLIKRSSDQKQILQGQIINLTQENSKLKQLLNHRDQQKQRQQASYKLKKSKYKRHIREIQNAKRKLGDLLQRSVEDLRISQMQLEEVKNLSVQRKEKIQVEEKLLLTTRQLRNQQRARFQAENRQKIWEKKHQEWYMEFQKLKVTSQCQVDELRGQLLQSERDKSTVIQEKQRQINKFMRQKIELDEAIRYWREKAQMAKINQQNITNNSSRFETRCMSFDVHNMYAKQKRQAVQESNSYILPVSMEKGENQKFKQNYLSKEQQELSPTDKKPMLLSHRYSQEDDDEDEDDENLNINSIRSVDKIQVQQLVEQILGNQSSSSSNIEQIKSRLLNSIDCSNSKIVETHINKLLQVIVHLRKQRDQLDAQLCEMKDSILRMENEKEKLNDRWMQQNEKGIEKIRMDMEQLKNMMAPQQKQNHSAIINTHSLAIQQPALSNYQSSTARQVNTDRSLTKRRGTTSTSTGPQLSERLDNLFQVLQRIESQAQVEGDQMLNDLQQAKFQIQCLQHGPSSSSISDRNGNSLKRRNSTGDFEQDNQKYYSDKSNNTRNNNHIKQLSFTSTSQIEAIEKLQKMYGQKEQEVALLQKYLDECQMINTRLREMADQSHEDLQKVMGERDNLQQKNSQIVKKLRQYQKQHEESSTKTENISQVKCRQTYMKQIQLQNGYLQQQNKNLKERITMLQKFNSLSPDKTMDFLKSIDFKSDLYLLSDDDKKEKKYQNEEIQQQDVKYKSINQNLKFRQKNMVQQLEVDDDDDVFGDKCSILSEINKNLTNRRVGAGARESYHLPTLPLTSPSPPPEEVKSIVQASSNSKINQRIQGQQQYTNQDRQQQLQNVHEERITSPPPLKVGGESQESLLSCNNYDNNNSNNNNNNSKTRNQNNLISRQLTLQTEGNNSGGDSQSSQVYKVHSPPQISPINETAKKIQIQNNTDIIVYEQMASFQQQSSSSNKKQIEFDNKKKSLINNYFQSIECSPPYELPSSSTTGLLSKMRQGGDKLKKQNHERNETLEQYLHEGSSLLPLISNIAPSSKDNMVRITCTSMDGDDTN